MPQEAIRAALGAVLEGLGASADDVRLERPRDPSHGDLSTNIALALAGRLHRKPREVAEEIAGRLDLAAAGVESVEVAGPGFLNFRLSSGTVASVLDEILRANAGYGRSETGGGHTVMVEFVSANPTGPLHLGHGRQAALGDAIASLLEWTGWKVHREYYYNDAGRQMDLLARSVRARYRQRLGRDESLPPDGYRGDYVAEVAEDLVAEVGEQFLKDDSGDALDQIRKFAVRILRAEQDRDLSDFRVHFDEYFLESSLYEEGLVDGTVEQLRSTGLVYEKDGATWLKTTEFGDQKDRVMIRTSGLPTYFLPDVAYHKNKWDRGFHRVVNVQGSDHHGTMARVLSGVRALGLPEGYPQYVLHQMVRVERDGQEVKFSKRAGSGVTLRELYEEVGVDVARYFFQMRKPDAQLLFDLDMALDQSDKNPVYKVQYAHARMCSIFAKAGVNAEKLEGGSSDLDVLGADLERDLLKRLREFPATIERAAASMSPHVLCDYLEQTAGAANAWYHSGNPTRSPELAVLVDDSVLRSARLSLARAVQIVLRNGLTVLGIDAPQRLVRATTEAVAS
ncbi:MAG: arginine--tRNA ligase [Gemmatimonadota bacterium]|nr:arginine--tRNA ligase [Gemmatimonadota bacterium]